MKTAEKNSIILNKNITLTFKKPVNKDEFINRIKEFANNVVNYLKSNDYLQLGHIKFITTTNGEDYLQLSVLDLHETPRIDGILRKTFEKIKMTLNVIVFGNSKNDIDRKLIEEIDNLENYFKAS